MSFPKTIDVCGVTYRVSTHKDLPGYSGYADHDAGRIKILEANPQIMSLAFAHEVGHAVFNTRGLYEAFDRYGCRNWEALEERLMLDLIEPFYVTMRKAGRI